MTAPTDTDIPRLYEKETAAAIRPLLRKVFQSAKFSVTVGRGAMVSSVHVRWAGGPTAAAVRESIEQFQAGNFNGLTDSYDYDDTKRVQGLVGGWSDAHIYRPGVKFIVLHRSES